jgi:hypothetical protein
MRKGFGQTSISDIDKRLTQSRAAKYQNRPLLNEFTAHQAVIKEIAVLQEGTRRLSGYSFL